jgi:hypothetical protein
VVIGKRCCPDTVGAIRCHRPRLCPLALSQHGSLVGVADALHMGTVRLSVKTPFGALAVWKMATVHVNAATPGVLSARWLVLPCLLCPAMAQSIIMLQIVWI